MGHAENGECRYQVRFGNRVVQECSDKNVIAVSDVQIHLTGDAGDGTAGTILPEVPVGPDADTGRGIAGRRRRIGPGKVVGNPKITGRYRGIDIVGGVIAIPKT